MRAAVRAAVARAAAVVMVVLRAAAATEVAAREARVGAARGRWQRRR